MTAEQDDGAPEGRNSLEAGCILLFSERPMCSSSRQPSQHTDDENTYTHETNRPSGMRSCNAYPF